MNLTVSQVKSFEQNGFLVIDKFYDEEEIKDFQYSLRELIRSALIKMKRIDSSINITQYDGKEFDEGLLKLEDFDHFYVADIYDTIAQTPAFQRLSCKKEITYFINQLLSRSMNAPLYTFTCRCRIDVPQEQARKTKWHQEVFHSIPDSTFLQTWAPLIHPATKEIGTIEVCVGSHKGGIALQNWQEAENQPLRIVVDPKEVDRYEIKSVEMEVGQVLIFDYRLFHRSGTHLSSKVRYSLIGMYHNATSSEFYSASISFGYKKKTPKEYYDEKMSTFQRDFISNQKVTKVKV